MVTNEDRRELRDVLERARQGSALANRTLQNIKQYANDGDPTYVELEAELVKMIQSDNRTSHVSNHFEWRDNKGVKQGYAWLDSDANGLPVLQIEVDDDHYSGTINHGDLFKLMTRIAEDGLKKQRGE